MLKMNLLDPVLATLPRLTDIGLLANPQTAEVLPTANALGALAVVETAGPGGVSLALVVINVLALVACVTVHEFGHAYVADRLGDPLPREQGRVTLNPLAHIDWLGTVIFPALMAMGAGIPLAWGKPVEWTGNPRYLTKRYSMRTIRLMVSTAGPAMNLLLALVMSVLLVAALKLNSRGLASVSQHLLLMNLSLMFFNLLPIPPLDGRSFLEFLPEPLAPIRDFLLRYGGFVFLALVLLGTGSGVSPLGWLMAPFQWLMGKYLYLLILLGS